MIKLIKSSFYKEARTKKQLQKFIQHAEMLSFSSECKKFESSFSKYQKRKHTVFVNSGSSANLALIQALLNLGRLKKGDKVGFSAITWSTNVMPIIELGLIPIPIDIELDTVNISSRTVKNVLELEKLDAIFVTNLLGFCDDLEKIKEICDKEKIILLEDNCESLGTIYQNKLLGNFGLASTCSFYVGHHMSTIEGGVICTDDDELADMLSLVRAHGWDRNMNVDQQKDIRTKHKVNSTFYSRYTFYDLGYNLRPTEINGFLGNSQLEYLPEIVKKRQKNFFKIAKVLYKNTNYYPLRYDHIQTVSNFAIPLICKNQEIRNNLVKRCENQVEIRPVVGGDMSKQPFYQKYFSTQKKYPTENALLTHTQGLYFGNNPELTTEELQTLIDTFNI